MSNKNQKISSATLRGAVDLPFRWSLLAGVPVMLCMVIMGLPDLTAGFAGDFRLLFCSTFLFWLIPVASLQRRLWHSRLSSIVMSCLLLGASYLMSVINNVIGMALAVHLGLVREIDWRMSFSGLDGCWLAFLAYFAIHAVLIYYFALAREKARTKEALAMAREAQLRALRYQLHPHFLFNTLNAISALVVHERNREANRMITELGDFLRATLEREDCHEHALADELALTESYLNIEKARLGSRLVVAIHVGPDVLQAYVPYLLLQPLMENAIRHGIAQRSEGGQIDVSIEHVGDQLQILVRNDIADPSPAHSANKQKSGGVGLRNVMERLENLYQGAHQFMLHHEESGRFSVSIWLPYRAQQQPVESWSRAA